MALDEPGLVATAGLYSSLPSWSVSVFEALINAAVKIGEGVGEARPGRKVLTLVSSIPPAAATSTRPTCCGPESTERGWPTCSWPVGAEYPSGQLTRRAGTRE